ncbi:hypothetical protein KKZ03_14170 [Methylobacter sp. S3L5C]|nr:hypothetical protein KKZ03_14170 [Methylobacter sp. S3L5C]
MSSFTSHSKRFKLSPRPLQGTPVKPLYASQHATVNCRACNRTMVPRVISYYGQPLRSICPFCGTTFMKFSSGLQQFMQRFHTRTLSFVVFKRLAIVALCFGLVWFANVWVKLPDELSFLAILGTLGFSLMALAELVVQCVEHIAVRLSHESNYYWISLIVIAALIANLRDNLTRYIILFSFVMLVRWFIAGLAQALNGSR